MLTSLHIEIFYTVHVCFLRAHCLNSSLTEDNRLRYSLTLVIASIGFAVLPRMEAFPLSGNTFF